MAIFSSIAALSAWVGSYVFTFAAGAGITFSTALAVGKVAAYLVSAVAYSALSSAAQRLLAPRASVPKSEVQAVIQQSDAPRRIWVGQNLAGGIRALFDVKDARLYQLVVAGHGKMHSFDQFWIDGEPVLLNASGQVASGVASGYVTVLTRDGSYLGGDYPELSVFSSWDSSRRLEGQATFLVIARAPKSENFMKVFPKAHQTVFNWVARGAEIFDPRANTTGYSDNAALVVNYYLTHPDGYRLDGGEIYWESVSALADWCDTPVPQFTGGTAPMMRLWGYWTLDEEPSEVLGRMATSSGIRAYETQDGRVGLIGGPFGAPACTLTAKDIRQIQTTEAISEREGYNTLRVSFMSAAHKYEMTEVDPWVDQGRVDVEGEISQELRPEMCPNQSQGRRLAKMAMHDGNRAKVEIITNLVGLKARYPAQPGQRHTILLDYRPEDGSGREIVGEYEVLDHEFDPVGLECRIELAKVDRSSQEWTPSEEGSIPAPLPASESDGAPDMTMTLNQRIIQVTQGVSQASLTVEAAAIAGRDDLRIEAEYSSNWTAPNPTWFPMTSTGLTAVSGAVADGATLMARARPLGSFSGVADWEYLGPITIQVNAVPPAQPTDLIVSPGPGYVHLSWRNPDDEFFQLRVYRNTSPVFSAASLVVVTGGAAGQISEAADTGAEVGVTYWYWVCAANASGVEGNPVGPATITL
ncbi:phage tail protein [Paenirhodobacter populi]|uniref:phage tail protein n=1 Tax=Paenirhodobacter populi TaxID=2306993 RepID=UPI000FE2C4B4|nr:phage tail protein [Sinirhodobacter populi]RWR09814.1 hypothetical protein D2T32_05595 [Sinirhodobacter populi]